MYISRVSAGMSLIFGLVLDTIQTARLSHPAVTQRSSHKWQIFHIMNLCNFWWAILSSDRSWCDHTTTVFLTNAARHWKASSDLSLPPYKSKLLIILVRVNLLTFVLVNKLRCHAYFKYSASQITFVLGPVCWYMVTYLMANSADPDQLASEEAKWSGSTLFAKTGFKPVQQDKGKCKLWRCNYD